jgi:hypothetical protein
MTHRFIVRDGDLFQTYVGEVVLWGQDTVTVYTMTEDEYGHSLVCFSSEAIAEHDVLVA